MVVLNVEADKLPKAEDLKSFLFTGTLCLTVSDQEIRLVSRGAFPDLSLANGVAPIAGALPAVQDFLGRMTAAHQEAPDKPGAAGGAAGPGAARNAPAAGAPGGEPDRKRGSAGGVRGRRPDLED
jgi:hypothetical protein